MYFFDKLHIYSSNLKKEKTDKEGGERNGKTKMEVLYLPDAWQTNRNFF